MPPSPQTLTLTPSWPELDRAGQQTGAICYIDAATGRATNSPDRALSVEFRYPPTMRDGLAIQRLEQEYAGGLRSWSDLEVEATALEVEARESLLADTFPAVADRPVGEALEFALDDAWQRWASPMRAAVVAQRTLRARLQFMARWRVLWHAGPAGWADIGDRRLNDDLLGRLMVAFAELTAEHAEGNG